jgi:hypothetical protein
MLFLHKYYYLVFSLSGAKSAFSMGVAPEAMMGCLQPIIGSKLCFFDWKELFLLFKSWRHYWQRWLISLAFSHLIESWCVNYASSGPHAWLFGDLIWLHADRRTWGRRGNFPIFMHASGRALPLCVPYRGPRPLRRENILRRNPFSLTFTLPALLRRCHFFFLAPKHVLATPLFQDFCCSSTTICTSSVALTTRRWWRILLREGLMCQICHHQERRLKGEET